MTVAARLTRSPSHTTALAPQGLEPLCFFALLRHTRVLGYRTIVMDGSRELVRPTLESGKRVQGDLWHVQKNWFKWSVEAIKTLCRRPKKTEQDSAELIAVQCPKLVGLVELGKTPAGVKAIDHVKVRPARSRSS